MRCNAMVRASIGAPMARGVWFARERQLSAQVARNTLSIAARPVVFSDARPQLRLVLGIESRGVGVEDRLMLGR
jgi:hypothetical protein